jgi:FkbM family methyltransferase
VRSFAQNFEDVMLERLFPGEKGFYVDVGAWDPRRHSVTKHFYDKGWRGINIEPIEERITLFQKERDRDVNLQVAISSLEEPIRMWICEAESYLSTTDPDHAAKLRERGLELSERIVPTRGLTAILDEFAPPEVQFIKIDVEGAEADVLATLDLRRWRPRVMLIEATEPAMALTDWANPEEHARWSEWEPALLGADYRFGYFDGLNRFYVRAEDEHLIRRFSLPPGVFDNIQNIDLEFQGHILAKLEASKKDRRDRAAVIQALQAQLDTSEKARIAQQEALKRLEAHLDISEKDRAARQQVIKRLGAQLDTSEKARIAQQEAIKRLEAQLDSSRKGRTAQQEVTKRLEAHLDISEKDRAARQQVIKRLGAQLDTSEKARIAQQEAIKRLEAQLDTIRKGLTAQREVTKRLEAHLDISEKDRAARQQVIKRLGAQLDISEKDRTARQQVIKRLAAQLEISERDHTDKRGALEPLTAKLGTFDKD